MKRVIVDSIIILLLVTAAACKPGDESNTSREAVVVFTVGNVSVLKNNISHTAQIKEKLSENDVIITLEKSEAVIQVSDQCIARVLPGSRVVIKSLKKDQDGTALDLQKGQVFSKIIKANNTSFRIKTPTVVASVRGTEFLTEADDNQSRISVYRGTVGVSGLELVNMKDINQGESGEGGSGDIAVSRLSKLSLLKLKKLSLYDYFQEIDKKSSDEIIQYFSLYEPEEKKIDNEIQDEMTRWNNLSPVEKLRELGKPLTKLSLNDGSTIICSVVSQDARSLIVDTGEGVIKIPKSDIVRRQIVQ